MARPKAKAPARRYHISGQSVVTIDGKDYYLGALAVVGGGSSGLTIAKSLLQLDEQNG